MRVLLVEDETMLRESLAHTLNSEFDIEVVETLGDAANVMEVLCSTPVDIILMDVCTEGGSSGIVAAKKAKEEFPEIRIVIMTGLPEMTFVDLAKEAGVDSFIYKNVGTSELLGVLRSTLEGYSTYPTKRPIAMVDDFRFDSEEIASERGYGKTTHCQSACQDKLRQRTKAGSAHDIKRLHRPRPQVIIHLEKMHENRSNRPSIAIGPISKSVRIKTQTKSEWQSDVKTISPP